ARLGLARSSQLSSSGDSCAAEGNVALAVQARTPHSCRFWRDAERIPELRRPARKLIDEVGLGGAGETIAARMSHGQHRQLELAMALATEPVMLLLAEPTGGLGLDGSRAVWQRVA